jgi:hypothetical protein
MPHRGARKCLGELSQRLADQALEHPGRNVDGFRQGGSVMLGNDGSGAGHPGFQAADFVPIAWLVAIEVAQTHLNPKDVVAETLQRSLNDAFNPSNQLFVAVDGVVKTDQDLHSSASSIVSLTFRK